MLFTFFLTSSDLTLQLAIEICRSEESSKSFQKDFCKTRTRAGGRRKGNTKDDFFEPQQYLIKREKRNLIDNSKKKKLTKKKKV